MVVAALLPATHKCNVVFPLAGTCSRGEAGHHAGEVVVVGVAVADEEDVLVILGVLRGAVGGVAVAGGPHLAPCRQYAQLTTLLWPPGRRAQHRRRGSPSPRGSQQSSSPTPPCLDTTLHWSPHWPLLT